MKYLLILLCLSLSACYAQHLDLDDPMGLPLKTPSLTLDVEPVTSSPGSAGTLTQQLETELRQTLPQERHVQVVAQAEQGQMTAAEKQAWHLHLRLRRQQQLLPTPAFFFGRDPLPPRVELALGLSLELRDPQGNLIQEQDFSQRGDAPADAVGKLEQQLLQILRHEVVQALQPHYVYR